MTQQRDIDLINDLLSNAEELSWLEFKKDNADKQMIGKLCSALANGARLANRDFGYLIWGIVDGTRQVIGTQFNPENAKVSNQGLQIWLAQQLKPSISFHFRVINHPDGRVVLLEIPAAITAPVAFDDVPYIRIGNATSKLFDYPERYSNLIDALRPYTWEHGIAKQYISEDEVLDLIDYTVYFRLNKQPLPDNRSGIFEKLEADRLITRDVGGKWNITNLGAILFATDLNKFDHSLARKGVRLIVYNGKNKASQVTHRLDGRKGYANGFEGMIEYINNILPINEHIGDAFRKERPLFPKLAIRELIANALIHQDMTVTGAGPQIELFSDRMEIVNPGKSLLDPVRMIDLPPRSRNAMLASLMRRMGLCEEQGSGLDKVITEVELYQLPPPLFHESDNSMQVILYAPRSFAQMTADERIRACYQHAVLRFLAGEKMKNLSLCERLGIDKKNAAQATAVIKSTQKARLIRAAEAGRPRTGYVPCWA